MTNEEKRTICLLLRQETGCGLLEASASIDKLIDVLKNRQLTVMDKPSYLKITWENSPQEIELKLANKYDTTNTES